MGVSADEWVATLAAAGVPAFHCRRDPIGLVIGSRTPEFIGVMQTLSGRLDERTLLRRLDEAWPTVVGDAPFEISAAHAPAWRCVVRAVDESRRDYLAILRLPSELTGVNDAYFTIVEDLPDVVTRYSRDLRCLYANPALGQVTGAPARDRFGKTYSQTGAPAELTEHFEAAFRRVIDTGRPVEIEFDYDGPAGLRHYLARSAPEFDHRGQVHTILSVVRDISEVKRLQHQLELLARTDPLTSVLNRRSFTERLVVELDRVRAGEGAFTVLMLDLDNFKFINDRFGHVAGDRVLEAVGRILIEETRATDVVARLGGDEFCAALLDTEIAGARLVAERIGRRVAGIALDDEQPIGVRASVGMVAADGNDAGVLDLLARVDTVMYRVKSGGEHPIEP